MSEQNFKWISVYDKEPIENHVVLTWFSPYDIRLCHREGNIWHWEDGYVCGTTLSGEPSFSSNVTLPCPPKYWAEVPNPTNGKEESK